VNNKHAIVMVREFFEIDFAGVPFGNVDIPSVADTLLGVEVRAHYDFTTNAKFFACYVPIGRSIDGACDELLRHQHTLLSAGDEASRSIPGHPGDAESPIEQLRFSGRLFVYHEEPVASATCERLARHAALSGISVKFRGPHYAEARFATERPRAFILHDPGDEHIARTLAHGLARRCCLVWFRGFAVKETDRVSDVFAAGVKQAPTCILIVSANFLKARSANPVDFHRIVSTRLNHPRLLHVIWYQLTEKKVRAFNPALAERSPIRWQLGPEQETSIRELHRLLICPG
jgi:hypothetical protein